MQLSSGSCCVLADAEVMLLISQRHEEPKEATDEHEKGTYVYFDYNIMHDDSQVLEPADYQPGHATCLSVTHLLILRAWSSMLALT